VQGSVAGSGERGGDGNRTRDKGFAVLCLTTWLPRRGPVKPSGRRGWLVPPNRPSARLHRQAQLVPPAHIHAALPPHRTATAGVLGSQRIDPAMVTSLRSQLPRRHRARPPPPRPATATPRAPPHRHRARSPPHPAHPRPPSHRQLARIATDRPDHGHIVAIRTTPPPAGPRWPTRRAAHSSSANPSSAAPSVSPMRSSSDTDASGPRPRLDPSHQAPATMPAQPSNPTSFHTDCHPS